jgi:hypothetical protein
MKDVKFPKEIFIAYAVCAESCGHKEFIVDGGTQVCEHCGKKMIRTEVKRYLIAEEKK